MATFPSAYVNPPSDSFFSWKKKKVHTLISDIANEHKAQTVVMVTWRHPSTSCILDLIFSFVLRSINLFTKLKIFLSAHFNRNTLGNALII